MKGDVRRALAPNRIVPVLLTAAVLALAAYELVLQVQLVDAQQGFGEDLTFYRAAAERWLTAGSPYLPHQLSGPYPLTLSVDFLYPPPALALFVPFVVLPAVVWWLVPLGLLGYAIGYHRPRPWVWPILAMILVWPRTLGGILYGNTDMWLAAFVALSTIRPFVAPLVLLKPTYAPLALIGVHRRAWWAGSAVLLAVSLALLPLWDDYLTAIHNLEGLPLDYSLLNVPLLLAPVIAYVGRSGRSLRIPDLPGLGTWTRRAAG